MDQKERIKIRGKILIEKPSENKGVLKNGISSNGILSGIKSDSNLKVLHVDDEPAILEQAKIFLEKENELLDIETARRRNRSHRGYRTGS